MTHSEERVEPRFAHPRERLQRRGAKRIALRVLADAIAISTALFVASIIRFEIMGEAPAAELDYGLLMAIAVPVELLLFWMYGLYEPRQVLGPVNEFKQVFHGVVAGVVVMFLCDSAFNLQLSRGWAFIALVSGFVIVGAERLILRKALHFMRRRGGDLTRTIVLGTNHEALTMVRTLEREKWLGYDIIGFVDDDGPTGDEFVEHSRVIGKTSEVREIIEEQHIGLVLVAATAFEAGRMNRLFWELQSMDVDLQITSGTL